MLSIWTRLKIYCLIRRLLIPFFLILRLKRTFEAERKCSEHYLSLFPQCFSRPFNYKFYIFQCHFCKFLQYGQNMLKICWLVKIETLLRFNIFTQAWKLFISLRLVCIPDRFDNSSDFFLAIENVFLLISLTRYYSWQASDNRLKCAAAVCRKICTE